MKIYFVKYKSHNDNTLSWNNFFIKNENVQKYLVRDVIEADMIVCAGGDGTLLKTVKAYIGLGIPVYGINAGTVGFLMNNISQYNFIADVLEREVFDTKSLRTIKATILQKNNAKNNTDNTKKTFYGFNEIAIGGSMMDWIDFSIDSKVLPESFKGGGMIISTPQGSTGINVNNQGVVIPIDSKQWVVTGDKTNIHLSTVIKPRYTKIEVQSRQRVTCWVDGVNGDVINNILSVILEKGPSVLIAFSDINDFIAKRYK